MTVNNKPMIDISRMLWRRWSGRQPTGIDRACLAYLNHFGTDALAVVQRGGFTRVLDEEHSRNVIDMVVEARPDFRRRMVSPLLQMLVGSAFDIRQPGTFYLNVGHTGLDLPGHARWVRSTGVNAIYYIHDIIPLTHPQYCRVGAAHQHDLRMRAALSLARGIITNSEDSAAEMIAYARREGLPVPPHLVAPLGLSIDPTSSPPVPIDAPYFLMVGTIEGRKNYGLVLKVWQRLAARLGDATPQLILVGARGWAADDVFEMIDHDPVIGRFVVELGQCNDADLAAYLAHARALLFPSFVEGQGLPLAEALAAGTPVIASDLGVFRETAGDIPDYLAFDDLDGWVELIGRYVERDSAARAAQMQRLAGYRPPSWHHHFALVDAWLPTIL